MGWLMKQESSRTEIRKRCCVVAEDVFRMRGGFAESDVDKIRIANKWTTNKWGQRRLNIGPSRGWLLIEKILFFESKWGQEIAKELFGYSSCCHHHGLLAEKLILIIFPIISGAVQVDEE